MGGSERCRKRNIACELTGLKLINNWFTLGHREEQSTLGDG